MKHNLKITFILLTMFIVTQFIGLYVVNHYVNQEHELPYGMETPEIQEENDFYRIFPSLIIAFVIAITLIFFLTKFKAEFFLKLWFFVVVIIALGITFNSILGNFSLRYSALIALLIAIPLAYIKTYKTEFLIHNLTELFIYPGIAAVFVPILNIWTIIILLILISIYDMWAVWHSGIMQKMAKFQINKLKVFAGFFVPYVSKKVREKIKKIKQMPKSKQKKFKNKKIRANVAVLGGGDVIFPIITAGVMLKTIGFIPALFVLVGATLGLSYLFFWAEKKKFYPAMPFITTGIFAGMLVYVAVF